MVNIGLSSLYFYVQFVFKRLNKIYDLTISPEFTLMNNEHIIIKKPLVRNDLFKFILFTRVFSKFSIRIISPSHETLRSNTKDNFI